MSNLIKYNSVSVTDQEKKVIQIQDVPFTNLVNRTTKDDDINEEDGFSVKGFDIGGMDRIEVEEIPEITPEDLLEEARLEAEQIIRDAENRRNQIAEQAKRDGYTLGYQAGYDNGVIEGNAQYSDKTEEAKSTKAFYEEAIQELEPKFAKVVISLVEKFVGVLSEEKEDIIIGLINQSMFEMDSSKSFVIKVSSEAYPYVSAHKDSIYGALNSAISMEIFEDSRLEKGDCLIETESGVVNCSLDVQLKGLITDIKLMANL